MPSVKRCVEKNVTFGVKLIAMLNPRENMVVIDGGSVVVKDIPSNVVAVGNPCRVVRPITDEDKLKSWDR